MPHPPYENIDPHKKQKLLEAAMREFAAHGYQLASINRILEACEFSKSSFYYYFDDKLDLAATVFLVAMAPELEVTVPKLPQTAAEFWVELRRSTADRIRALESKRLEYECLMRLGNAILTEPAFAARVLPSFGESRRKMGQFFQRGVELGALRSDLSLATQTSLIEAAKTAAYKSLYPGDRVLTDHELESFTDLVLDLARRICAP